jgi:hypothetical protein
MTALRWSVVLGLSILGMPAVVRADMAAPFWYGERQSDPRVRFENLSDYPDLDFYLIYQRGSGNPHAAKPQVVKATSEVPTPMSGTGRRIGTVLLLSLPRGESTPILPEGRDWEPKTWMEALPSGASCSTNIKVWDLVELPWWDLSDHYLTTFRIRIEGPRIYAEERSHEPKLSYIRTIILGLAFSLIFITVGFLIARRRRKSASQQPPPSASA